MKVSERLREIRIKGIETKLLGKNPLDGKKRSRSAFATHEDGIEVIIGFERRYVARDKRFVAMRKILEEEGVPTRRLAYIRAERHIIITPDKVYSFFYPSRDYIQLYKE